MESASKISKVRIISIDGMELPAVSPGTSPFIGAGQFGSRASSYRSLFFDNVLNMVYSVELGLPCVQFLAVDRVLDALGESKRQSEV
jgi:hypothetical protein